MKNLIIGNTSQISHYFDNNENNVFISSRNIDFDKIKDIEWNRIYLCYGESRKFLNDSGLYNEINYELTKYHVDTLHKQCKKIIIFSTCELWNRCNGKIDLLTPQNYYNTPYLSSKSKITNYVLEKQKSGQLLNVIIIYPFNFNSIYRKKDFLFGKVFNSIINKELIEIGNTHFYRDIISPKYLYDRITKAETNEMVGSGRMIYVNDFIKDLYSSFGLKYKSYVKENTGQYREYEKTNEYYFNSNECMCSYENLLQDTVDEIKQQIR